MQRLTILLLAASLLGASPLPRSEQTAPPDAQGADLVAVSERGALLDPIMTADERARWNELASDAERETFLQTFWDRRDPTPGTELNEVREIFLRRARRAARMFTEGSTPGWGTDRGRVLLVHGLPQEIEARAVDGTPAPEIVWTYGGDAPVAAVRFVRRDEGYAAELPPSLGNEAFLASTAEEVRLMLAAAFGGAMEDEEPAAGSPGEEVSTDELPAVDGEPVAASTPADAVSPEVRVWMQLVLGGVQRDDLPLRSAVRTFPAQDGTYTTLAFHVGTEDLEFAEPTFEPELQAVGLDDEAETEEAAEEQDEQEEEAEGETEEEEAGEEQETDLDQEILETVPEGPVAELKVFGAFLQGPPGQETTVHQFIVPVTVAESEVVDGESPLLSLGVTLVPGTYRLAWGVMDAATERAATRDTTVSIPDFATAGLVITEPLVARPPHATATSEMSTQSVYRGVRLGNVLISDDIDRTFGRDEIVELVTMVTGWSPDPNQPGRPRLEVLYRILEGSEGEGVSIARLQPQSLDFHVLGQQIPLAQVAQLEEGKDYRILIQVTDSVSGKMALKQVPISIRGDGETASEE